MESVLSNATSCFLVGYILNWNDFLMASEQTIYGFDTIYHYAYPLKWYLNNSFFGIGITIAKGLIHSPPVGMCLLNPLNHVDKIWG